MIIYSCVGFKQIDDQIIRQMSECTPWRIKHGEEVTIRLREKIVGFALLTWATRVEGMRRYNDSEVYGFPENQYNQYGKPYLVNEDDIYYNTSHCTEEICLVISDQEVGIDIERIGRMTDKVMNYFLNSKEILAAQSDKHPKVIGCWYWTKKESYSKYLGIGIHASMKETLKDIPDDVAFHSYCDHEKLRVITVCGKKQDHMPENVVKVGIGQLIQIMH